MQFLTWDHLENAASDWKMAGNNVEQPQIMPNNLNTSQQLIATSE
jgi:hypothetical protein